MGHRPLRPISQLGVRQKHMEMIRNIALYFLGPIMVQRLNAFRPSDGWKSMLVMYKDIYVKTWVVRGLIGALICFYLSKISGNQYFYLAIKQVLSPLFWNIVVALGVMFTLIAIVFLSVNAQKIGDYFLDSSRAFLCFASEVGALMYGVLLGILIIGAINSDTSHFKTVLLVSGGVVGLLLVLFLNLLVWWLAFCIQNKDKSPAYFEYVKNKKSLMFLMSFFGFVGFTLIVITTTPNN